MIFIHTPDSPDLGKQSLQRPCHFAVFGAVGVVHSHIAAGVKAGEHDEVAAGGEIPGVHGADHGCAAG